MENLNVDEDVNRVWENIKENIKTSAKESLGLHEWKQHNPWFDKECVDFLDQRKQAKIRWIQDPSRSNVDNLNNIRRDASRQFRNKKEAYMKGKIEKIETSSKIKNVRDLYKDINDFNKDYQTINNRVQGTLARCRNHFSQLLNVHGVNDVRHRETHTQQNHLYLSQGPLRVSWLLKS